VKKRGDSAWKSKELKWVPRTFSEEKPELNTKKKVECNRPHRGRVRTGKGKVEKKESRNLRPSTTVPVQENEERSILGGVSNVSRLVGGRDWSGDVKKDRSAVAFLWRGGKASSCYLGRRFLHLGGGKLEVLEN